MSAKNCKQGVGVAWQQGAPFHDPWGIRMNFALPYAKVVEAFDRLKELVLTAVTEAIGKCRIQH